MVGVEGDSAAVGNELKEASGDGPSFFALPSFRLRSDKAADLLRL